LKKSLFEIKQMTKKVGKTRQRTSDVPYDNNASSLQIDVQYNPDIVAGLLQELGEQVDMKCSQIQTDTDFIIMQLQQQFQIELIKIPTQIKKMSLSKFRQQYGDSLDLIPKANNANSSGDNKIRPPLLQSNSFNQNIINHNHNNVMETPFAKPFQTKSTLLGTAIRAPKEGEFILSANGSPLGGFTTAQKLPRGGPFGPGGASSIIPQTPGVFVPLKSGEIVDIENIDVTKLDQFAKDDALAQMQAMMDHMQNLMSKLGAT
jgi:hypothetical protein